MLKNNLIYVMLVWALLLGACSNKEPEVMDTSYKPVVFEKSTGAYPHRYTSVSSFMRHEYPENKGK